MMTRFRILAAMPLAIWLGVIGLVPDGQAEPGPRLRPLVEVSAAEVRLGDLFDGAGRLADRTVMAAPPPGETVYLNLAQVFELANSHGLAWRPVAPFETVAVRRAWRHLDSGEIRSALVEALHAVGAPRPLTIELPDTALDIKVGRGTLAELSFENTNYTAANDRFQTTLVVHTANGRNQRYTLAGTAYSEIEVPVLNSRLRADQVIRGSDINWRRIRRSRLPVNAVTELDELIGNSPVRTVTPGRVLTRDTIGAPMVVARGALVSMHLVSRNMHLVATGRAQDAGAIGDVIQVQNISSRIAVDAVVTGANRVMVRTGAQLAAQVAGPGEQLP